MIYTGLSRTGEIESVKAHGGGDIAEVYGGLNETDPIFYKSRTIAGTLPLNFKSLGKPLSDYLIEGNTIQNGTPTPSDPVDVVGCGEWDATEQSYKLPITCANVTSNIYLGNVQTTRKIKKLVLTGEEEIGLYQGFFYIKLPTDAKKESMAMKSTHFYGTATIPIVNLCCRQMKTGYWGGQLAAIQLRYDAMTSVSLLRNYLQQQYASGTPVTVWYVLTTPETGIVNEPLHKIGDYADTITMAQAGVTLPTTAGTNTLSVGTTVQPSVSITGNIKEVLV